MDAEHSVTPTEGAPQEEATQSAAADNGGATTTTEVNTYSSINASLDDIEDVDVLKQMVTKLRRENANRRTKEREHESELTEFRTWKESQMTELEKTQAQLAKATGLLVEAQRDKLIATYGLESDAAEFIGEGSFEEMQVRAEKLAALTAKRKADEESVKKVADLAPGTRGAPVGQTETPEDAFKGWLRANR